MQNYKKALEDAQEELFALDAQIEALQKRHAQLETTIASLKNLMGEDQEDTDRSLTDLIRTILMGRQKFTGVGMISLHIRALGIKDANQSSIVTILNRLARNNEIIQGQTDDGKVGYMWKPKAELNRYGQMIEKLEEQELKKPKRETKYRPALAQDKD